MPGFNGSGVYIRPFNWTNDAANGIDILANKFDTDGNDVATALSTCILKDGQQTATAQIPFAQGITVGVGAVGTPAINVVADTDTGFWQPSSSAGTIAFSSNGTKVATLNANGLDATAIGGGTPAAAAVTTLSASGASTLTGAVTLGSTLNKVTITAPVSHATFTLANNKTLTVNNTLAFSGTDSTVFTFPGTTDTVVTLTATQTLTNKTLTAPAIGAATGTSLNLSGLTASAAVVTDGSKNLASAVPTSWTPVLQFGGGTTGLTYTTQIGDYIQIGKAIIADWRIVINNIGSSTGAATISGLPANQAGSARGSSSVSYCAGLTGLTSSLTCRIDGGSAIIRPSVTASTGISDITNANFANGCEICGTAVYISA